MDEERKKKKKKATGRRKEERKKKKKKATGCRKKKIFLKQPNMDDLAFSSAQFVLSPLQFLHILGRKLFDRRNEKTRRPISIFFSPL